MGYEVPIDRSVNCYFCGEIFDERYTINANPYNDGDGGEACRGCLKKLEITEVRVVSAEEREVREIIRLLTACGMVSRSGHYTHRAMREMVAHSIHRMHSE